MIRSPRRESTGLIGAIREPRILLVEDNAADVHLFRLALRHAELTCDLTVIEDGAEALSFAKRQGKYSTSPTPDLAVLDLNLPKADGVEVLDAMRATSEFSGVPVVILSSSSSPRERARVNNLSIARFITKPLQLDEFLQMGFILKSLLDESIAYGHRMGA